METTVQKKSVAVILILSLMLGLCGGCNEGNGSMKLSPIYSSALMGALVGGIVGYQSDEPGEGAAVGAAIFGVGALFSEMDQANKDNGQWTSTKENPECPERVIVDIHNDNGSITPVTLKKKGDNYIGPKGERYEELPTEEQLKPVYGL
ncbi:MAG: hypothetical protein ABIF19_08680 [Planctomycetota bacterium]